MVMKYLKIKHKNSLLKLLQKYQRISYVTLAKCKGSDHNIEFKEDVEPYHAEPFPLPKTQEPTLKKEVDRLIKIGILKKINNSQWAAPTFIIPKKYGKFIFDFRELNKRVKLFN